MLIFTLILVASSFTCQLGVFSAERGDVFGLRRWYALTMVMGLAFVIGEANDYHTSVSEGTTVSSDGYGSVYYITTGFHMLQVIGGLTAFTFLIARTKLSKFTPAQATAAIVVSYYWHFVLLALRRHRVGRPVRNHLHRAVTTTELMVVATARVHRLWQCLPSRGAPAPG